MTAMSFKRAGALLVAGMLAAAGCKGSKGDTGPAGTAGPGGTSTGTLGGKVTIAGTSPALPVVGATIALSPAVAGVSLTTNATGDYTAAVPIGVYTLTISASNFTAQTKTVSVAAGQTATQNVALAATAPVVAAITTTGSAAPGATLDVSATVTPLDGSTVQSYSWSNGAVAVTFADGAAASTTATLPAIAGFKTNLFRILDISPVADVDDDPSAPLEEGTALNATVQNRFKVQAINHFELERAGEVTLTVTVTTTSGTYSASKLVSVALPYAVASGIAQVPVNVPVVVHGKALVAPQTAYSYALAGPGGDQTSLLDDATSRNPVFTPPTSGKYTLTETGSGATLDVYAGTWVGVIDAAATSAALDAAGAGNPVGVAACTVCHTAGGFAPDMFTPWAQSGHAQILSQNVNAGGHYSSACFDCHTVGFGTGAGGIDEQSDYAAMLAGVFSHSGSPVANPLNWKTILDTYPNTARMANIQCEDCHGPQTVTGQNHTDAAIVKVRASLDSGVCGRCHGEPARHGRYQEWSISGHANFTVAIGEGLDAAGAIRSSCASCHTAQGALQYFAQLKGGNASRTLTAASLANMAGLSVDNVEPQTCAVCHEPHFPGTVSAATNDVAPRIMNDTPLLPGGFKAVGVGKGAVCITCHNSRNGEQVSGSGIVGLHEDGDALWGTLTAFAAPHEACQGDVLMGRNAYFVSGVRGAHSNLPNACTNCHMERVAPPTEIGYPTGQTNHTFEANLTICSSCHGAFDGAGLQASVVAELADLKATVEATLKRLYVPASTVVFNPGRSPTVSIDGAAAVTLASFLTAHTASAATIDILAKTNWNYELVDADFSKGVHNPSFVQEVLFRTTQKVNALSVP